MLSPRVIKPHESMPDVNKEGRDSQNASKARETLLIPPRLGATLLFVSLVLAVPAEGQLSYSHTSFVNGYGSDSTIWTSQYADIQMTTPLYLSQRVNLHTVGYANLSATLRYSDQVGSLVTYLTRGGQHVLVGHSLGSLVSRGAFIDSPAIRSNVAAIVALTPPHQGAPIAENFGLLRNYLKDMQRRIQDAVSGFNVASIIYDLVYVTFAPKHLAGFGPALFAPILYAVNGGSIDVNNLDQFGGAPALVDLVPSSAAVSHLNSRFDDGAIPRANIYATIPFRNAALRLLKSMDDDDAHFDHLVTVRNLAQEFFSTCKWAGYVTIVTWTSGRRCAYARKTLGRLDERWAKYVNGPDQYGNARYVPFDGIVPNDHSNYPSTNGLAYQGVANLINHINVYKTRAGLEQAGNGMLAVGMQPSGNPPPPPPSLTASISGPDAVNNDWYSTWSAEVSGGTPPYSYAWSGLFFGYNTTVSGSTSTSGNLILDVYDSVGSHITVSKFVTATGCSGQQLC